MHVACTVANDSDRPAEVFVYTLGMTLTEVQLAANENTRERQDGSRAKAAMDFEQDIVCPHPNLWDLDRPNMGYHATRGVAEIGRTLWMT